MEEAAIRALRPEDLIVSPKRAFMQDVLEGLCKSPKQIPSAYFYDDRGSKLFQQITELEEYYLTRCELDILTRSGKGLSGHLFEEPFNLIELGAGDGKKALLLLEQFTQKHDDFCYMPIDISRGAMGELLKYLRERLPAGRPKISGLVAEYFDGLNWLSHVSQKRSFVLFLGSNIGNFDYAGARRFLCRLWSSLSHGDLALIGFDLKKDIEVLERAYRDSRGITEEFNLNLLDRINRELGGDFRRDRFTFRSHYNVASGAVESWLVSTQAQEVHISDVGRSFFLSSWEGIHTEASYKYSESDIERLAAESGFSIEARFTDEHKYFADYLWRVKKAPDTKPYRSTLSPSI